MVPTTMNFSMNNGNLLSINHSKELIVNNEKIELKYNICSVSISPDKIFVAQSKVRDDGFYLFDENIPPNNVDAYDFTGKKVWSINDVTVDNLKLHPSHFYIVVWHNYQSLIKNIAPINNEWNPFYNNFHLTEGHEYLECHCAYSGIRYIIDLTDNIYIHHMVL